MPNGARQIGDDMAQIRFFKVATLPGTLEPDSFYFVENGSYSESYLTNSAGVARSIGNSTMINALINEALSSLPEPARRSCSLRISPRATLWSRSRRSSFWFKTLPPTRQSNPALRCTHGTRRPARG